MTWMLVAVAIGTWSGYLGLLRALQGRDGRTQLPGRFNLRIHKWTGIVYYAMLFVGILGGLLMAEFLLDSFSTEGIWRIHTWLGVAVGAVYAPGAWLGLQLLWKPGGSRTRAIAHMVLNYTACTLIGVQILVALLAVNRVLPGSP
jgi:hypothetical protein